MSGIIKTQDGSYTLEHPSLDATYHSTHGALTESQTVFIKYGLDYLLERSSNEIRVLEIGFGSGLNALLTLHSAESSKILVEYTGIELYPVDLETIHELDYPALLQVSDEVRKAFISLHADRFVDFKSTDLDFSGRVIVEDFHKIELKKSHYDLIYFDAFGPGIQPHLWNDVMAQKMFNTLRPGGILTTYSVQGAWRRHLKSQGFDVTKLPGPPGKREVMRAVKS